MHNAVPFDIIYAQYYSTNFTAMVPASHLFNYTPQSKGVVLPIEGGSMGRTGLEGVGHSEFPSGGLTDGGGIGLG